MKGYGMGGAAQGRMTTHQAKKLDDDGLLAFRDRFAIPLADADAKALAFHRPAEGSAEREYLVGGAPRWAASCRSGAATATPCRSPPLESSPASPSTPPGRR